MKQTLLVALASAAIGAGTASFFSNQAPPPVRSSDGSARIDVAILQEAMTRALHAAGFGQQARAASPQDAATEKKEKPAPAVTRSAEKLLPPPDPRALESARSFEASEETRREWMFLSEREVIRRLGIPQSVFVADGGEYWVWKAADGKEVVANFNNGRLLRIDG